MTKQKLIELIEKFNSKQITEEEHKQLNQYFDEIQNQDFQFESTFHKNLIKKNIWSRLQLKIGNKKFEFKSHIKRLASIAAMLLIVIITFIVLKYNFYNEIIRYSVVKTNIGEHKHIVLGDNTNIWLGPKSSIKYPEEFSKNIRSIEFHGDAIFEVHHENERPFIVQSGKMKTKVLGTTFDISTGDSNYVVTLISGKIIVSNDLENRVVAPNQMAIVNMFDSHIALENNKDSKDLLLKKEGKYVYNGQELKDVITQIEKNYNCSIDYNKQIENCLIYGSFEINDSLEKIIKIISVTLNGTYKNISPNKFILSAKGCS